MGTRNLTAVMVNGEYKIAQYGQWDGYPDGQGITALEFLRDKMDKRIFLERLAACRFGTNEELETEWQKGNRSFLTRDNGAKILELVQKSTAPVLLQDEIAFAGDSLMCEWAWVIDFDKGTFEAYKGFNKEPLAEGERFAAQPTKDHEFSDGEDKPKYRYHGVKHRATFQLSALPSNEDFLAEFKEDDEREDV